MKAVVGFLVAVGVSPALYAAADAEKSRELTAVQSKIQQVGADIKKLSVEKLNQLEQLKKLDAQFSEFSETLNSLKTEIREQEEHLRNVRAKVGAAQKNIQAEQHSLEGLIKSAYAIGNQSGLKGILNLRDPSLSGRIQVYYDYVGKARLQKLYAIQEDVKVLQQLEAQKDEETRALQALLSRKQQETAAIQSLKSQREKLLAQLDSDYQTKQGQMLGLVKDEKKLTALVASLQKTNDNAGKTSLSVAEAEHRPPLVQAEPDQPRISHKSGNEGGGANKSFELLQGQLPWPVQGVVSEHFGHGAVIHAREGADIHAVAAGRVVYAKWLSGYGLMVIVDHGKGYMSLYAFNQSLHKSVGDVVVAGETLASVGHSGGRSEAALYFSIRKNGRPVNPEHWCKKPIRD